jgi:hypothetical protein
MDMAGPRRLNVVSVFLYLLLALAVYGAVQYTPYLWKKMKLENLVKDESYAAARKPPRNVAEGIIERAGRELSITLDPEDVQVDRLPDRVRIHVTWRFAVDHPFQKITHHQFQVNQETVFY